MGHYIVARSAVRPQVEPSSWAERPRREFSSTRQPRPMPASVTGSCARQCCCVSCRLVARYRARSLQTDRSILPYRNTSILCGEVAATLPTVRYRIATIGAFSKVCRPPNEGWPEHSDSAGIHRLRCYRPKPRNAAAQISLGRPQWSSQRRSHLFEAVLLQSGRTRALFFDKHGRCAVELLVERLQPEVLQIAS